LVTALEGWMRASAPNSDRVGRAKLRQWLSFISAELHKGLMTPLLGATTPPEVKAWTVKKYAPRLAYLDAKLKGREFLLDRFSVADGYLATVLNWTRATPEIDLAAYPCNVTDRLSDLGRVHARATYQRSDGQFPRQAVIAMLARCRH
jgi:glutathione S-transferase